MKMVYPAIFEECEEGGYTVSFPDLGGCFTEGDDITEALEMAEDAAKFHWSAIYTLNLSVFVIRVFVALTSLFLAPWKGKNPKSSPSN